MQRHKKPLILRTGEATAAFGVFETTNPNTIDALRDGTSFPEECGEENHIGSVLEPVNQCAASAKWLNWSARRPA
ncbi:hypothetical protein [Sphingomonas sp.]|uniref:hypothetical protein n=1 Tax=Sphingomonas sp. TaxID=28214 RepID=UPI003341A3DA